MGWKAQTWSAGCEILALGWAAAFAVGCDSAAPAPAATADITPAKDAATVGADSTTSTVDAQTAGSDSSVVGAETAATGNDAAVETAAPVDVAAPDAAPVDGPAPDDATVETAQPDVTADMTPDPDTAPNPDTAQTDTGAADDAAMDAAGQDATEPDTAGCVSQPEKCDGLDNDCDGKTDETDATPLCATGKTFCESQVCAAGKCVDATSVSAPCDDGDPCTLDTVCVPGSGGGPCPPGKVCVVTGISCKNGTAKVCNDGDACTVDKCVSASGGCTTTPTNCNDNNVCTTEGCDPATGCTANLPVAGTCTDGNVCSTGDFCKDGNCALGPIPLNCDDANVCTADSCMPMTVGCKHAALPTGPCSDGSACTTDVCYGGACKATAIACDDKNVCTLDSCDMASGCTATAIAGCKNCTTAGNCDDANICTTDACTGGKCTNATVAGCKGPADFYFASIDINGAVGAAKVNAATGPFTFNYIITNDMNLAACNGATLNLWASPVDSLANGSIKVHTAAVPNTPALGTGPSAVKSYTTVQASVALPVVKSDIQLMKFLCAELIASTDTVPGNNVKCAPVDFQLPDFGVTKLQWVGLTTPIENATIEANGYNPQLLATVVNTSGVLDGSPTSVAVQFSVDAKPDPADVTVGYILSTGTILAGKQLDYKFQTAFEASKLSPGPGYLCVTASSPQPAAWTTKTSDDSLCVPVTIAKTPELALGPITAPPLVTVANAALTLGTKFKCTADVVNSGVGIAGAFDVRCTLRPNIANAAVVWQTDIKGVGQGCCGAAQNFTTDLTLLTIDMVKGVALGQGKLELCMVVDPANAVTEITETNNSKCLTADLLAPNLVVITGQLGTSTTTVKRDVALSPLMNVKNIGNSPAALGYGLKIYASKDNKVSAEDVELCGSANGGIQLAAGAGAGYSENFGLSSKCTIPGSFGAGAGFLIFVVDPANLTTEFDETDNALAVPVTVQ